MSTLKTAPRMPLTPPVRLSSVVAAQTSAPREDFVWNLFQKRGEYNVFHEFYRTLVQALYDERVTRNGF
jgi:hypothetical protein